MVSGAVQPTSPVHAGWPNRPQLGPQPPVLHVPPPWHVAPEATQARVS
jgi:hypothetical protein